MRDNLQKQFDRLLKNTDLAPPPAVWERIEAQLPQRQRRQPGYRYAAALFFLVTTSVGFFLVYDRYLDNGGGDRLARSQKIPVKLNDRTKRSGTETRNNLKTLKTPPPAFIKNTPSIIVSTNNYKASVTTFSGYSKNISTASGFSPETMKREGSVASELTTTEATLLAAVAMNSIDPNAINERTRNRQITSTRQELLASVGVGTVYHGSHRNLVLAALSPQKPLFIRDAGPDWIMKDPEKACKREKLLEEFKTFDVHRGFHLGGFIGMNMTWMSRKFDLFEHEGNIIDPKTHVGLTFGMVVGYDIREKWGIQFEPAFRNSKGQHFEETCVLTGETLDKKLTLRYFRFPFMLKYKLGIISSPERRPMVLSVLAGPTFNILNHKIMLVSEEPVYVSPNYVNHAEIGVMAGFDLDFYISKNLYLSTGTRLSVTSPMKRDKPVSIQLGLHTQFNFRMPPREKIKH